jgi:hypothetical protein
MKTLRTLADITPDPRNANKGTVRGGEMLAKSLRAYGAARSIVTDKNGRVIAGSKTLAQAVALKLGLRVVESNGRDLVVVQRTDLDADAKEAKALAIADNRVAELDLEWDADVIRALVEEQVSLEGMFHDDELAELLDDVATTDAPALSDGGKAPIQQMTFTLHDDQVRVVMEALGKARAAGCDSPLNENHNGNALTHICEAFLHG